MSADIIVVFIAQLQCFSQDTDCLFRGNTMDDIQKRTARRVRDGKEKQQLLRCPRHMFNYNKQWQRVWGELGVGGGNGCLGSDWLQPVAHIQITVMSLPGLCSAVLWNERQDVWLFSLTTSHHGNSLRARSLALKRTFFCHLLAVSPLDRLTCWRN